MACVLVSMAVALWLAASRAAPQQAALGDGRTVASYGFDLSTCLVDPEHIVAAGMPRDGLHSVDAPTFISPAEVEAANEQGRGKLLVAGDRVVGVAIAGDARAYPLRLLRWHEVVNDTVGGEPVAITYNPLCDSVAVFSRAVGGEVLDFGVSGLLISSNLLLYDRREDPRAASLWSQLQARAVAGPAAARRATLELIEGQLCTWGSWRQRFPKTGVLAPDPNLKRLYKRDPYHSYFGSDLLRFPVEPLPPPSDLRLKDRVVAVTVNREQQVFALSRLAAAVGSDSGQWQATIGGLPVRIDFATEAGVATVKVLDEAAVPIELRYAFWFAWYAAFPTAAEPLP